MSTIHFRAEEWIRRVAWIGKHDDPCAVASEAAGIMRELLDQPDLKVLADHSEALKFVREMSIHPCPHWCADDCLACRAKAWLHEAGK